MQRVQPQFLLRLAGAMAGFLSLIYSLAVPAYGGQWSESISVLAILIPIASHPWLYNLVTTLLHGLFLVAFWQNTRQCELLRPRAVNVLALSLQAILAAMVSTELLCLVSAEVALVLPLGEGIVWLLCQAACEMGIYAWVALQTGTIMYGLHNLPFPLAMALLGLGVVTYSFLSYSLGFMAAAQMRQTLDLRRTNGELLATQQMEAETARLAERLNLSRELHDAAGHHLMAISVNLQLALKQTQGPANQTVEEALASTRLLLQDVRGVVSDLRDLKTLNLVSSLRTLAASIPFPAIHLAVDDAFERIEPLPGHTIFRCAQELLTNALKHASARNIWVTLRHEERAYELAVRDDGQGAAAVTFGNGLTGLRERARELGGHFGVSARASQGFEANLSLPRREGVLVVDP
jgi:signal transduction histidine kinase